MTGEKIVITKKDEKENNKIMVSVEKDMATQQPTPLFLPGESHGQRSLAGYSPWGRKSWA